MIPFVDLKHQYNFLKDELHLKMEEVLSNSSFILGKEVENFERNFAKLCNKNYAVAVNSGTDAIFLSLLALGIKKDDEVILPVNTFIATALAISHLGGKPVFVDADEKTYNIDTKKIKEKITKKTKLILPVHLYGQPANMDEILQLAEDYNLQVLEDCCQAHNAEFNKKKTPISEIGCFSFYPSKNLGAYGDGGAVVLNSKELYEKIKKLRNYGETKKYYYSLKGLNSRLDELQAAILNVKLKYLNKWTEKRIKLAELYSKLLKNIVITPYKGPKIKHVYHLYVIKTKHRNELKEFLEKKQIFTGIHYPLPIHKQESYKEYNHEVYTIAENLSNEILSLPMYPELTEEQVREVCDSIKEFITKTI